MIMQELLALFRGLQLAYHHDHLCLCIIVDLIEGVQYGLANFGTSIRDSNIAFWFETPPFVRTLLDIDREQFNVNMPYPTSLGFTHTTFCNAITPAPTTCNSYVCNNAYGYFSVLF
ncbi:hypothetical protein P3S68_032567 [Capsicum galapagoense]